MNESVQPSDSEKIMTSESPNETSHEEEVAGEDDNSNTVSSLEKNISELNMQPSAPLDIPPPRDMNWGDFSPADTSKVLLRTAQYLESKKQKHKKSREDPSMGTFMGSEIFRGTTICPDHIASLKDSQYHELIQNDRSGRYFILINNRATGQKTCCCSFWYFTPEVLADNPQFASLWQKFIDGDDEFRNQRFKCYPVIIDGSWILKQMVPNVPTLLGMKVPITYWKGRNYLEIGVQCDQNYLAQSILSIAFPIAKKLTVDQCYILQSENEDELPEVVFAGIRYTHPDLSQGLEIDTSHMSTES